MKLKKLIKRVNEISRKNQRDRFEYFSLARELNSLTLEEKKSLISEALNDEFITVEIREMKDTLKSLIARLTGQNPKMVKLSPKIRRSIATVEHLRYELMKSMEEDDAYLGTFAIAIIDMYLDANELYWDIYNIFEEFDLMPKFNKEESEEEN